MLLKINESRSKTTNNNVVPFWRLGFRPFFFLATTSAMLLLFLWIAIYAFRWPIKTYFSPIIWHGHEMLFGFVAAVIVGFVLTASQNWTGKTGIFGFKLQLLAAIWLLARIMPFFVLTPNLSYAFIDLSFLALACVFLLDYIPKEHSHRTIAVLINIVILWIGNCLVHLGSFFDNMGLSMSGLRLGVGSIVFMVLTIAGRIIPNFSRTRFPSAQIRSSTKLDISIQIVTLIFVVANTVDTSSVFVAIFAVISTFLTTVRLFMWGPHQIRREPMLVFLYIAYLWLIIGFGLRSVFNLLPLAPGIVTHAFTVGGIGIMVYAMIPRVSLGHTGRPISANRWIVFGFVAINLAAIMRVAVASIWPMIYIPSIIVAGILWIVAFLCLSATLTRIWWRARLDGRFG